MSYRYGKSSERRLSMSTPEVKRVMRRVIHYIDCSILCTFRDADAQARAVAKGFSEVAWPDSDHNYTPCSAIDVGIWCKAIGNVDFADHTSFAFLAGIIHVCAIEEGCVAIWGHDWDHDFNFMEHAFKDRPHFLIITREEYDKRKKA